MQLETPIGDLSLIARDKVLIASSFTGLERLAKKALSKQELTGLVIAGRKDSIASAVQNYFAGDLAALDEIKVEQPGGIFSQRAWRAMRKVKAGRVLTYSELAARAGSPKAVRAAGSACAKNQIVLFVPCHRVIKTGGGIGNYAFGLEKKEWLLQHEGAL